MAGDKKFNVRVYGLLLWQNQVLVTDEWLRDQLQVTKFPGGGLEWGEGIADCLQREFMEELSLEIEPGELFYINDFFQRSAYHPDHQVLSIYYFVQSSAPEQVPVKEKPFDFERGRPGEIVFRWVRLDQLEADDFYFPIDKVVTKRLRERM